MKVTLATSTATMPMEGMPILYACLEVKPAVLLAIIKCYWYLHGDFCAVHSF